MRVEWPPKGKKVKRKLQDGPWAGLQLTFTQLQDGSWFPPELVVRQGDQIRGRYHPIDVEQRTRTVTKWVWQPVEEMPRKKEGLLFTTQEALRMIYLDDLQPLRQKSSKLPSASALRA